MKLWQIYKPLKNDLGRVETRLAEALVNGDEFIARVSKHLLQAKGKRLRPALVLLSAKAGKKNPAKAIDLAVAIELIHTATLIHDDVIDEAVVRRRYPSLNKKFGKDTAILFGDYLYSRAFEIISALNLSRVTTILLQATNAICQAEIKQLSRIFRPVREKEYLQIVSGKTASLFSACCETGGLVAGADQKSVALLKQYGYNLGVSFQIVDDCLDLVGSERSTGKTTQLDAKGGKMTLPHIFLHQHPRRPSSEAIAYALKVSKTYEEKALAAINEVKEENFKRAFKDLVYYVGSRVN